MSPVTGVPVLGTSDTSRNYLSDEVGSSGRSGDPSSIFLGIVELMCRVYVNTYACVHVCVGRRMSPSNRT